MSSTKKIVTTYAKSLFQNVKSSEKSTTSFEVSKLTAVASKEKFVPDVYIIGEELLLIRSTLITSKKLKAFFTNPTYLEQQKLNVLLNILPGLTVTMKSFLKVLAERSHLSLLPEITDAYTEILMKFKNSSLVKIITASALQENYGLTLLNTLKSLTKSNEVILNIS